LAAIAAAPSKSLSELRGALPPAFAALSAVLEEVTPDHLAVHMDHRVYGSEPLANYVSRDIIGHKRQHIAQLRTSFDYLAGGRICLDGFVPVPRHFAERYRRDGLWQGRTLGELFDHWAARSCGRAAVSGIDVDGVAQHLSYAAPYPGVMQTAVVAMKDRVLGERVCAFLVTRRGAGVVHNELNQFLLRRGLAKFKLPEPIETLEELPLTNVGKVNKKALRDLLA